MQKPSLIFLIISLCLCFAFPSQAQNTDVIFDLDWTLISPTTESAARQDPQNIIRFQEQLFRLNPYALPVLEYLSQQPNYRIHFFSGGSKERNEFIVNELHERLKEINPGAKLQRVLNKEDMQRTSAQEDAPFAERYKKDLEKVGFNLKSTILVDDIKNFTPQDQSHRLLWLGSTFEDTVQFSKKQSQDPYQAKTLEEWQREKLKLVIALDRILKQEIARKYDPIKSGYDARALELLLRSLTPPQALHLRPFCRHISP